MASNNDNDADQKLNDVILRLDLARVKSEKDMVDGEKAGDATKIQPQGNETSKRTSGSFVDNLKKIIPGSGGGNTSDSGARSNGSSGDSSKASDRKKLLKDVKVDKLPQGFVCKYLGSKPCSGLWGVRHTRQPVDELVVELRSLGEGQDLPLVNVKVSTEGLKASVHVHNKSDRPVSDAGLLPLQFISYAVQDPRYTRIFVFILVREMSSRQRKTECHAYLCASDVVARQMALSMDLAFQEFSKKLDGKPHKFQVDLRDTDELETELSAKMPEGTEFEA